MSTTAPEIDVATQDFLRALASETRQQILQLFVGDLELSVGEVAERAGLGQSTASEHLTLMRRAGLLESNRNGKTVRYRVDSRRMADQLDQLKAYLIRCCPPRADRGGRRAS